MSAVLQKAREMFLHAVGKLPSEQWDAYVAEVSGGDADLERQVLNFLDIHREGGSFLDRPAVAVGDTCVFPPMAGNVAPTVLPRECAGATIGPYKLLQQIGEGGMGVGLHGRADRAGAAEGGAQGHQAGHGQPPRSLPASRPSGRRWR